VWAYGRHPIVLQITMQDQDTHGGQDPSPTPIRASDCEHTGEANYFGKDFLRMAGIVQMLHAHNSR